MGKRKYKRKTQKQTNLLLGELTVASTRPATMQEVIDTQNRWMKECEERDAQASKEETQWGLIVFGGCFILATFIALTIFSVRHGL